MKPKYRNNRSLCLFVTVGTTRFDKLVDRIITRRSAEQLASLGFTRLILQVGKSEYDSRQVVSLMEDHKFEVEVYDYKSSISEDIDKSDVVVGHAGAGTCLEVLRRNKRLLVVVNEDLMDNHQSELADTLSEQGYLIKTTLNDFEAKMETICERDIKLKPFPPMDALKFEQIFNETLKRMSK